MLYTVSELASKTVRLCLEDVSTIVNFTDRHETGGGHDGGTKVLPKLKLNPNKEHVKVTRDQMPSTTFLKENDPWISELGPGLNEIEFSANVYFRNVKFKPGPGMHYMIRNYFKEKPQRIYVNENENYLTTERKNARMRELIWPAVVFRIDQIFCQPENHQVHGDPTSLTTIKKRATGKLRIFQRKFVVEDVGIKLSGSTEIDLSEATDSVIQAKCLNERKYVSYIVYWYVILPANAASKSYTFRVAFRLHKRPPPKEGKMNLVDLLNAFADTRAECNIECEDEITGPVFLDCVKALSVYYKFQHETTNEIEPELVGVTLTALVASNKNSQALNEQQIALLTCMKLKHHLPEAELSFPNVLLGNFVGALSVKAWAKTILKHVPEYKETSKYFESQIQLPDIMF